MDDARLIVRDVESGNVDDITFIVRGKDKVGFKSLKNGKFLKRFHRPIIQRERVELHQTFCRDAFCKFTIDKWIEVRPKSLGEVLHLGKRVILMADNNKYLCSQR